MADSAFIQQLVYAGADFRKATPNGWIPYQKAPERVQAVIAQAERMSGWARQEGNGSAIAYNYGGQGELQEPEDQGIAQQGRECWKRARRHLDAKWALGFLGLVAMMAVEAWLTQVP